METKRLGWKETSDLLLKLLPVGRILPTEWEPDIDLSGVNLSRADLTGADLANVKLVGANLGRTRLSGSSLSGANLTNAYLAGANLEGADLISATLFQADLSSANLSGACLEDVCLTEAWLQDALLVGADLSYANLKGSIFNRADFTDALLENTGFAGAIIEGAVGVWSFSLGQHDGYFQVSTGHLAIGCVELKVDEWVKFYKEIGEEHDYLPEEIQRYGDMIALCFRERRMYQARKLLAKG